MHSFFFEVFQLAKLEEIQIPSKFEILLTQSQTDPVNPTTMTGWAGQTI